MRIKTIDVNAKGWFDKTYGNSYFAGTVCINFGMKSQKSYNMPFQYGYGDFYLQGARDLLVKQKVIKTIEPMTSLWKYCDDHKIILRHSIQRGCLKRELMQY